jgi:hypothetical protein
LNERINTESTENAENVILPSASLFVMAGLVPAIHVDPRVKPGDDEMESLRALRALRGETDFSARIAR